MSLRDLLGAGVESTLRGILGQSVRAGQRRLSPGVYDAAIQRTIDLLRIRSRYDRMLLRDQIGPNVLERFRQARRLNTDTPPDQRRTPYRVGERPEPGTPPVYEYLVRGRMDSTNGTGQIDFTLVIQSSHPLNAEEIFDRARRVAQQGEVSREYRGRVPEIAGGTRIIWSIIDTTKRNPNAVAGEA